VRLAYRIVDVFSDRPLAGNALCVVLDPVPPDVMQAIAREVNLSETTFPVVAAEHELEYDVRIFTPGEELPFAGHPTLGTAWVLGPGRWTQHSPGADVVVTSDAAGSVMSAPRPTYDEIDVGPVVAALGIAGAEAAFVAEAGGIRHIVVPTDAPLDDLTPDVAAVIAICRAHRATSMSPIRRADDATLHVRAFCPATGITEDPGTGSLAGPAALIARDRWGMDIDITIRQGIEMGRPCTITVRADSSDLRVGGHVTACAEGHFTL
jgi:trans-2,3-dihydro-3-hydroxyanthranilate isomerase